MENNNAISREDYEERCCPLSKPSSITPVPIGRVIDKLDEYLGKNDLEAGEKHLKFWLKEAEAGNDARGKLTIVNEQIGIYRKLGREAEALDAVKNALALAEEMGLDGSVTMGTTLINAATALKAFRKTKEALPLYETAKELYEASLPSGDARLGGLYNNMALTVTELGDYGKARELYEKALLVMSKVKNGEADMAITYCNLADLTVAELGELDAAEKVSEYLEKAMALLSTESLPKDGYYAFVCEKCAPTFGYYGYFAYENKLSKLSEEIYERA